MRCGPCLALLALAALSPALAGQRYALVIGIDGYRALDKLPSCVADAEAVAKVLEESGGFKVIQLTDRAAEADRPTLATVRRRIEHVATVAEKGDTVLLFFSGHGVERGGAAYLVPIDGDPDNAIPLAWVNERLEKSAATAKVAIFDCCHAGAKSRGIGGISGGLRSAVMLLSCSKGELSHNDATSGHGVFTGFLIQGLRGAADGADESAKDSQVTISELYRYVRKHVVDWSLAQGKKQTPLCLPEEGSGVALVRLKTLEELQKQREALKRSLGSMQEAGRQDVVKALQEEIARLEAQLASLGKGAADASDVLKKYEELKTLHDVTLKNMLDVALKTHQPTSRAVAAIQERREATQKELVVAAKVVLTAFGALIESRRATYKELTRELLPTAPKARALEDEIKSLEQTVDEVFHYAYPWPFDAAEARQRQKEAADALGVHVEQDFELSDGVKIMMVLIPAGEFTMGSPEGEAERQGDEKLHRVTISKPFWMGKYEATQEQWEALMGSNPSRIKGAKNPVASVSWEDIQGFLQKLNARVRGGEFALPAEAQWEYACRAGTSTPFYFGATLSTDQANYDGNYTYGNGQKGEYRQKTLGVGSLGANAWGLHDMHGNVAELCRDWYETYDAGVHTDPTGPTGPGNVDCRVLRGGSWRSSPIGLRSARRELHLSGVRDTSCGFRVVRLAAGP